MDTPEKTTERLDFWKSNFKESLDRLQKIAIEIDPAADLDKVKYEYLFNQLAALAVGCEELGKRIRAIEKQINGDVHT